MIEILNGIHETVAYDSFRGIKLHHSRDPEDFPIHWHSAMEIILPVKSEYTAVINGTPHPFQEGDIWITSPGVLHSLTAPPAGDRTIILFDYSLICNVKGMDSLLHVLHPYRLISQAEYPELNRQLRGILEEITREYDAPMPFTEAHIYSLLILFFVTLGRTNFDISEKFPSTPPSKQYEYIEKLMKACSYLSEHCTEDVSIDELAEMTGFSKFHFSRLFKQFTGVSCCEYLTQKRIAHAETLLIQPRISIIEVAMRSGFGSLPTFNRIFKARMHCTPSEYKQLKRARE